MKRYRPLYLFTSVLLLLGYAWLIYVFQQNGSKALSTCMFHNITRYPCPSCGTTRSMMALIQGHLLTGILINPFGLIVLTAMIILPLLIGYDLIMRKLWFIRFYLKIEKLVQKPKLAAVLIFLVIANWIWNIYKEL